MGGWMVRRPKWLDQAAKGAGCSSAGSALDEGDPDGVKDQALAQLATSVRPTMAVSPARPGWSFKRSAGRDCSRFRYQLVAE